MWGFQANTVRVEVAERQVRLWGKMDRLPIGVELNRGLVGGHEVAMPAEEEC